MSNFNTDRLYAEIECLKARIEELEVHVKVTSRAGFIAGVVWSRTDTDNKSLNTAADDYSAGNPL